MDDLIDDDFGDLYVDVPSFTTTTNLFTEPLEARTGINGDGERANGKLREESLAEEPKQLSSGGEKLGSLEEEEEDGSESSEDDFNIVLNDDDCKGFSSSAAAARNGNVSGGGGLEDDEDDGGECGGSGSGKNGFDSRDDGNGTSGGRNLQYPQNKAIRSCGSSLLCNSKGNESVGNVYGSGEREQNLRKQFYMSNPRQAGNSHSSANSAISYGGYCFSLPWYRTILDVNIEAFEDKRWRHPGVDQSDFFNFGFNEESWKEYCISVEELRHQSSLQSRIPVHESSRLVQGHENGSMHESRVKEIIGGYNAEFGSSSKCADVGERPLGLPKGRTIQVENGSGERQPTMILRPPRSWDSDVVIQINVHEHNENSFGTAEEESVHTEKCENIPLISRDLNEDEPEDVHNLSSASKDEVSAASSEGIIRYEISDSIQNHHGKADDHISKHIADATETDEKAKVESCRTSCKSLQELDELELSDGEHSHFLPSLSVSGSESEASEGSVYIAPEESSSPLRRSTLCPQLKESVVSFDESPKSDGVIRKVDTSKNCLRNQSPNWKERKHQRFQRPFELKIPADTDDVPLVYRDQSSSNRRRQIAKHDFEFQKRADHSRSRQRHRLCGYGGERLGFGHANATKHPYRRYCQDFADEMKHWQRMSQHDDLRQWNKRSQNDDDTRQWDKRSEMEREYFHNRSFKFDDQDDACRDWYSCTRGLSSEDMIPSYDKKSKELIPKYDNMNKRGNQWSGDGDQVQFRSRTVCNSSLLHHKNRDELMQGKCGSPVSFANCRRDSSIERYEWVSPFVTREPTRRPRYDDGPMVMDLDLEIEDKYCYNHQIHLPSRSNKDFHASNEGRWLDNLSPRGDICASVSSERYRRYRRQAHVEDNCNNDFVGRSNDASYFVDDVNFPANQVRSERSRYGWQSRVGHWREDFSHVRYGDDEFHTERASKSHSHEKVYSKHGSTTNGGIAMNNMNLEWDRYKVIREESSRICVIRNHNKMYKGELERVVRRCSSPLDYAGGEGKSSRRCSNGGSLTCHSKFEDIDLKFAEQKTDRKVVDQSETCHAIRNPRTRGKKGGGRWVDKFPVTGHNEGLDIEEGQIVTEDPNLEDPLDKNVFENGAPLGNMKNRNVGRGLASGGKDGKPRYDNQRILETLAKMEKRRERFKEPITLGKEPDNIPSPQIDLIVDSVEAKPQRPTRKRRWVAT